MIRRHLCDRCWEWFAALGLALELLGYRTRIVRTLSRWTDAHLPRRWRWTLPVAGGVFWWHLNKLPPLVALPLTPPHREAPPCP